jgi:pimeloyl-ACP methyl ester carboxylesterase
VSRPIAARDPHAPDPASRAPIHRFSTENDLRLHALDHGGHGRTTIFLHGITGNAWMFNGVAARLRDCARILAVDLRGHGDSQWSADGAYASADAASDIVPMLRRAGGAVDLVGSSWGGLIALLVAEATPDLVRRIVVIDVAPATDRSPDDVRPKPVEFRRHQEVVDWERGQHPKAGDEVVELLATQGYRATDGGMLTRKYDPLFLRHWAFRAEDHWDLLARISQPTLVIRGGVSTALSADTAERMVARLAQGRLATLEEAGHMPEIAEPGGVADLLTEFLGAESTTTR